jgi:TonB family protein
MAEKVPIFESSRLGENWHLRRPLPLSVALHLVIFIVLLRGRSAVFVAPKSSLAGAHGSSITHIYWAGGTSEQPSSDSSSSKARERSKSQLVWKRADRQQLNAVAQASPKGSEKQTESASTAAPAASAGSPYGSLSDGSASGEDVRPALPAVTSEPHVNSDDLRGLPEGNVVVEIIIDETGNIVRKSVTQSMGPAVDAKVLAALENWHFHPATRDGVPIPSKQDVVYHFKPRPG